MGFLKDIKDLQEQAQAMTPPERRRPDDPPAEDQATPEPDPAGPASADPSSASRDD
jgi:hypothetical protein